MISWMQNLLEKHLKWLFIGLLVVIIIAFVFTIGAGPGLGEPDPEAQKRDFYGFNLNSLPDMEHLQQGVLVSQLVDLDPGAMNPQGMEMKMLGRAVLIHLANELDVPNPNEALLRQYLESRPLFQDKETQAFSKEAYDRFLTWVRSNPQYNEETVSAIFEENFRIAQVENALATPGYVLPYEAKLQMELLQTKWTPEIAMFDYSTFKPDISVTDEELENYYQANTFAYERPAEVVLSYVQFSPEAFLNQQAEPSVEELKRFYEQNPMRFAKENAKTAPTFDKVESDVKRAYLLEKAQRTAEVAGNDFTYALFEQSIPYKSDAFESLMQNYQLKLQSLPSFSQENPPTSLGVKPVFMRQTFTLDSETYYTDPLPGKDGLYVFFFEKQIPASIAPFREVKDQVRTNYEAAMKKKSFSEKGLAIEAAFKQAIAAGSSFEATAQKEGLTTESFEAFTLENPPGKFPKLLLGTLQTLKTGDVSPMITDGDEAYFVYLASKEVPSVDLESEASQEQIEQMEMVTAMMSSMSFLQSMIQSGLKEANDVNPL
ncbi:MAG: hypothetical protein Tsb0018_05520 [Opitutales bacterium]